MSEQIVKEKVDIHNYEPLMLYLGLKLTLNRNYFSPQVILHALDQPSLDVKVPILVVVMKDDLNTWQVMANKNVVKELKGEEIYKFYLRLCKLLKKDTIFLGDECYQLEEILPIE